MGLIDRFTQWIGRSAVIPPWPPGIDNYLPYANLDGILYPLDNLQLSMPGSREEEIEPNFTSYVQRAFKGNSVVFSVMRDRMALFSQARFQYRNLRTGKMFGNDSLKLLEHPWPNGATHDLLAQAITDVDIAGNFYATLRGDRANRRIKRMHPDWVTMVFGTNDPDVSSYDLDAEFLGILYHPGGKYSGGKSEYVQRVDLAHFAPIPDPEGLVRGMSWITPVVREIMGDSAATSHKLRFFENAGTPNMVISRQDAPAKEAFDEWRAMIRAGHQGAANAYKWLFLTNGATATPIGRDMQQLEFKATQGAGEPLALDTPVPTPTGWTTMGDVEPGDEVFGRDGRPCLVTEVHSVHEGRECYRVTFSDKTSIVADGGHLWLAMDRNTDKRAEQTYTTDELRLLIAEWVALGIEQANRIGIPAGSPVQLGAADLLVDPYVLGVWLGDGATAGAAVSGAQPDLDIIGAEIERRGYTVTHWATRDKTPVIGLPGGVLAAFDALGVLGGKFIPPEYLRASHVQRLDLLRGLMDTDGTIGRIGKETCEYSSKLEGLARQVAELARSLGYRVTVSRKAEPRSRTGETWRVTFRADPDVVPFFLPRKAERVQTPVHVKNRAIVSIEPVESVPVRCITVDSADHLFRAGEGWTLTHNTRIAAASGIHPVIAGLSEGLAGSSLNQGNFAAARRLVADKTLWWLWGNFCGSMETLIKPPAGTQLWIDASTIPFLREDRKDAAEIQQIKAATIGQFIRDGFTPESAVAAVDAEDDKLLVHTGLVSVQLQPPGTTTPEPANGKVAEEEADALVSS